MERIAPGFPPASVFEVRFTGPFGGALGPNRPGFLATDPPVDYIALPHIAYGALDLRPVPGCDPSDNGYDFRDDAAGPGRDFERLVAKGKNLLALSQGSELGKGEFIDPHLPIKGLIMADYQLLCFGAIIRPFASRHTRFYGIGS